jgi:hypothetical protein
VLLIYPVVAKETNIFKLFMVERYIWIVYVLRRQAVSMVDYVSKFLSAFLTYPTVDSYAFGNE